MAKYLQIVRTMLSQFDNFQVVHIPRDQNTHVNTLSKLALGDLEDIDRPVYTEVLERSSVDIPLVAPIMCPPDWMTPIRSYIVDGFVPDDPAEAQKLIRKAAKYTIIRGALYKRSILGPFLRCLTPEEADYALHETHEGICGQHLGGRSLSYKILRQGFFWPTI
ncbi:uncharacterized protein [Rutidosis leptorrhynchoides]|uniref:uncharacterized protein n=1 Tax=Rutidosis leptorrhynchoides TaxID=125765 RepID=UPI003A98D106